MGKSQLMAQVRLEKKLDGGLKYQVAWIPLKFAKKGVTVKLKYGEDWDDGWVVVDGHTGGPLRTTKECAERANDHKKHRRATDV